MDAIDNFDSDIDDITLSQICEQMENEHEVFDGISTLTVSQAVVNYLENENDPLPSNPDDHVFDAVFDLKCDITEPCSEVESNSTITMVDAGNENIHFLPPVSDKEVQHLINSQENANTRKNTAWAVRVFEAWRENRNTLPGAECVKELHDMTSEEMNYFWGVLSLRRENRMANLTHRDHSTC